MKGRPPLPPHEKKADAVRVRLTAVERVQIEAQADKARMSISEYLRVSALQTEIKIIQGKNLSFEASDQIRRVGVNLNQITKALNAKQESLPVSLVECTEKLNAIFDIVYADLMD